MAVLAQAFGIEVSAGGLSQALSRLVTTAHRSAKHLLGILNDVLDFSMVDAGRLHVAFEPVDLRETVRDVCSLFQAGQRAGY